MIMESEVIIDKIKEDLFPTPGSFYPVTKIFGRLK